MKTAGQGCGFCASSGGSLEWQLKPWDSQLTVCYWRNFEVSFLPIFIILSDIEESTIRLSYFYLFKVQRWPNRFVYITINRSCCPLNCSSVQAKSPICRSPNCLSSCSTFSSPSAATTSMSGSKQPWVGQACQLPGLALHLYHQVVSHHPGQLVLEAQQHLLAPEKCQLFFSDKLFWQLWRAVLSLRKSMVSRCKRSLEQTVNSVNIVKKS